MPYGLRIAVQVDVQQCGAPGPQVLTNTPLESAAQSKEGHVSQRMLEHYSHVRMDAKRKALDALSRGADGTKRVTNGLKGCCQVLKLLKTLAGTTGLEPATSCVTGMRSNQLNYVPSIPVASDWSRSKIASSLPLTTDP